MRTITIRIAEDKHARLRNLAKAKGVSINRLFDELTTLALGEFDSETRFWSTSARGSKRTGTALLEKLDRAFAGKQ